MVAHSEITSEQLWQCIKTSLSCKTNVYMTALVRFKLAQHCTCQCFSGKLQFLQILQFADHLIGMNILLYVWTCMHPNQIQWEKCQLQLEKRHANFPSGLLVIYLIPLCIIICCILKLPYRFGRMKPDWLLLKLLNIQWCWGMQTL